VGQQHGLLFPPLKEEQGDSKTAACNQAYLTRKTSPVIAQHGTSKKRTPSYQSFLAAAFLLLTACSSE
jgi:hypothetical protein